MSEAAESFLDPELLRREAGSTPERSCRPFSSTNGDFDWASWVAAHLGANAVGPTLASDGDVWDLQECPWGDQHSTADASGAYIKRLHSGAMVFACRHDACGHRNWHDLREFHEPGYRERRLASIAGCEPEWLQDGDAPSIEVEDSWPPPIPFDQHSVPPFPTDVLAEPLRDFVAAEAVATRTPADLAGCLALAATAAGCAKGYEVEAREGWREPLNIFTAIVSPPGTLKSAVVADTARPIAEYEAERILDTRSAMSRAAIECEVLTKRIHRLQENASKAKDPMEARILVEEAASLAADAESVRPPAPLRLLADDATPERLSALLAEQRGRLAVLAAEGTILEVLGRYQQNAAPNMDALLKAHAGDMIRVDRVGRPAEMIDRPALTLGLTIQPDVLRSLQDKPGFRGRGLLGRFLWSVPKNLLGFRDPDAEPVQAATREAYHRTIRALLDRHEEAAPRIVLLSPEARALLVEFMRELEPRLGPSGDLATMTDWAGKLAGAVVRIAGGLHLSELVACGERDLPPINGSTMLRALALGHYFTGHARAAFAEMGSDSSIQRAREVLSWILARGKQRFSQRDLHADKRASFPRSNDTLPALKVLEERGYVRREADQGKRGPGRRPSPVYLVNPRVFEGDRT